MGDVRSVKVVGPGFFAGWWWWIIIILIFIVFLAFSGWGWGGVIPGYRKFN